MTQATFQDAAAGWVIFKQHDGQLTLIELNQALEDQGNVNVSNRTFNHYRKLARLGYTDYVSINRLDLRHSNESVFDIADRARYTDHLYQTDAILTVPTSSRIRSLQGQVTRVSEGYATFITAFTPDSETIVKAQKYKKGILTFQNVGVERPVEVFEWLQTSSSLNIVLAFRSLLELDAVFPNASAPVITSELRLSLGPRPALSQVLEMVRRAFDLLETSRGIIELAAAQRPETAAQLILAPARVQLLSFENPAVLRFLSNRAVVSVAKGLLNAAKPMSEAAKNAHGIRLDAKGEVRAAALHAVQVEAHSLDLAIKRIEVVTTLANSRPIVLEELGIDLMDHLAIIAPELEPLKNQGVSSAVEISLASLESVELVEVGEDDDYVYYEEGEDPV